jgi:3-hydroxybutyrate dehydrogenase
VRLNQSRVITGAASGIGKEIARTFARAGAKLAIADLDAERRRSRSPRNSIAQGGQAIAWLWT